MITRIPAHGKFAAPLLFALTLGLFVAGVLSPYGARANPCHPGTPPEQAHEDAHEVPCTDPGHDRVHGEVIEVNAGRDQELTLNVFPPRTDSRLYLDRGDQMAVELEGFDLSGAFFRTQEVDGRTEIADIEITDSVDTPKLHPTAVSIDPVQESLTLTLPDLTNHAHSSGEHLVIIIRKGTGMLAPEIPRGFDEKEDPYRVEITFVDSDDGRPPSAAAEENSIAVRNPVSSTVPGATVRVELATFAENVIHGTDEISVDFSGLSVDASFTVPATVTPSTVQIRHGERTYNPSSVLVRGQKVILTVPSGEDIRVQIVGDYTITFSQSAEIKNPFSAGNRIITVSSFVHGNDEDQITAVIRRTTFVTPGEGARGSAFTLEGRGYADGTVTVFDGNDDTIGSGETLASVNTEMGAFQLSLTAKGTLGQKSYRLWTLDSNGVTDATEFTIESSMSFQPDRLEVGSQLKITISDWDDIDPGPTAVTIGGRPAFVTGAQEYEHCFEPTGIVEADDRGVVSLYVNIPAGVPSGIQTVSVYGSGQLQLVDVVEGRDDPISKRECSGLEPGEPKGSPVAIPGRRAVLRDKPNPIASRTIEVAARPLQLIPDTAARGQRITILGSGFDRISGDGRDIRLISVGGREVAEAPSRFEVPSNGDIALTVTVPDGIPDGLNEVRVEGRDESHASGTLTVPEPAVTVAPEQSGRGSRVRVAGTGFIANGLVSLFYGDGGDLANGDEQLGAAVADSKGGFTAEFRVPIDTELGKQHRVTAVAREDRRDGSPPVRADGGHSLPGGKITASPKAVCPGDTLTIRGENLPPFAYVRSVHIGGVNVSPGPLPTTDRNGVFATEVTVPHLELGNQIVRAEISNIVLADVVEVVGATLTGPPRMVFKEMLKAGVLFRIWKHENSTQNWFLFDPNPVYADFNTLTHVGSDDILWVGLHEPHTFQGDSLASGWNLIKLD